MIAFRRRVFFTIDHRREMLAVGTPGDGRHAAQMAVPIAEGAFRPEFQSFRCPSSSPETSCVPSGLQATELIGALEPLRVAFSDPSAFQIHTLPREVEAASRVPSFVQATDLTSPASVCKNLLRDPGRRPDADRAVATRRGEPIRMVVPVDARDVAGVAGEEFFRFERLRVAEADIRVIVQGDLGGVTDSRRSPRSARGESCGPTASGRSPAARGAETSPGNIGPRAGSFAWQRPRRFAQQRTVAARAIPFDREDLARRCRAAAAA